MKKILSSRQERWAKSCANNLDWLDAAGVSVMSSPLIWITNGVFIVLLTPMAPWNGLQRIALAISVI